MASFTPQKEKKNNKECRGSIANLNLQFDNDFGTVKLSIGNYHEEKIPNMIYLLSIEINEESRGKRKCKPLLKKALLDGKTRLLNSSFKTEGKSINGLVHIDTSLEYFKRAKNCYIESYSSIGLNIIREVPIGEGKTNIYFRSDKVIPESGASGAVMSRKPGKKRNRRKDGKKPRQFTFTSSSSSSSTSSPSSTSPSSTSPSSASSSGLGSFSPDDLLVQRMDSLLSPSGSPDRRRRKPSKPSPGQRMFQQALSPQGNKKGGRRKSLFKKKRTKRRRKKRGYGGKSPKRTKRRRKKRGYGGKSTKRR